jgi:hypothetical protein
MTIKDNGHLLERVASRLGVEEVNSDAQQDEHHDEDEVVLPADFFQSNRVDESIEEDRNNGSRQGDHQTTRTQAIWPDLARIGSLKRCPGLSISICVETKVSSTYIAIS